MTIDPTGDNTRWRYSPPAGCRLVGSDVGSSGVVVLQRCDDTAALHVELLDGFGGRRHLEPGRRHRRGHRAAGRRRPARRRRGRRPGAGALPHRRRARSPSWRCPPSPTGRTCAPNRCSRPGSATSRCCGPAAPSTHSTRAAGCLAGRSPRSGCPPSPDDTQQGRRRIHGHRARGRRVRARSLADGAEVARSTTADDVPAGGRTVRGRPGRRLRHRRRRSPATDRRRTTEVQGTLGGMVLPGGSEHTIPDDLRQLAAHDAARVIFPGRTGPLAALDTGATDAGTVLLVAGFTGSKEDFAPLLTPIAEAGLRAVADRPARAVRVPRPGRPRRVHRRRAGRRRRRRRPAAARRGRPARCTCSATASAAWSPARP